MPFTRALVLAGGRSSRFNGIDKTFALLAGRPLVEHVIERIGPQVGAVAISSNVQPGRFSYLGVPVIADVTPDVAGPLAGIYSGLMRWPEDALLTVAVDLPFLPRDLVARLRAASGFCAYASHGGRHAAALLWAPGAANDVGEYIRSGQRDLRSLLEARGRGVDFPSDALSDIMFNVNTRDDLVAAERRLEAAAS